MAQTWTPHRALSLGCEVRLLADNTLKTTGTIYGVIYDRRRDVYWTGAAWSASLSAVSLTHEAGGNWRYSLAASAWADAAEVVLLYATDDSGGAASATVYSCKEESAFASPVNLAMIADFIESQRGHHTWQGNQAYYVDPHNGTTISGGADGSREKPLSTITEALSLVTQRHAVIFLRALHTTQATLTETISITKAYVFFRGPGRDFLVTRAGAGDTITVSASGVEWSGVQIGTANTGAGAGVKVQSGADFFYAHGLWILNTQGHGIELADCDHPRISECVLEGSGVSASGHGIALAPTSGTVTNAEICRNRISDVQGDGVRIAPAGGAVVNALVCANEIHGATGWGINVASANSTDAMIHSNKLGGNTSGAIQDLGTDTVNLTNVDPPTAAANADAVWDEAIAGHVGAGSTGAALDAVPTTGEINTALEAAHGTGSWQNVPSGTNLVTITVTDADGGAPLVGAMVRVYDSTETNVLRGGTTDGAGQVSFYLDNGTYAARVGLANYAFAAPATFVVDQTPEAVSITGTALGTATPPVDPTACLVFGVLRDAGGVAVSGATVKAYAHTPQILDPDAFSSGLRSTTTAADGTWSLELVQGVKVVFEIESAAGVGYYKATKTVPALSTQDFATW